MQFFIIFFVGTRLRLCECIYVCVCLCFVDLTIKCAFQTFLCCALLCVCYLCIVVVHCCVFVICVLWLCIVVNMFAILFVVVVNCCKCICYLCIIVVVHCRCVGVRWCLQFKKNCLEKCLKCELMCKNDRMCVLFVHITKLCVFLVVYKVKCVVGCFELVFMKCEW